MPPGGGFISPFRGVVYHPKGVVLSFHWAGGGGITPWGWFYPTVGRVCCHPFKAVGGGMANLYVNQESVPEDRLHYVYMFCCMEAGEVMERYGTTCDCTLSVLFQDVSCRMSDLAGDKFTDGVWDGVSDRFGYHVDRELGQGLR